MSYPNYPRQPHAAHPPPRRLPPGFQQTPVTTPNPPFVYNRQQTGHSIIEHLLFGGIFLWVPTIYYALSPNHYFHL